MPASPQNRRFHSVVQLLESRVLLAVQPLDIGAFRGRPGQWGDLNGTALFTTSDPSVGQRLWATDGTGAGTRLVKDLESAPANPGAWALTGRANALVIGDTYYFTGVDNTHGRELWKSDGTTQGTGMVADLIPGAAGSEPEGFVELNGQLFFSAAGKLWRSDGTMAVVVKDADPLGDAGPERMAAMDGHVYFMVYPQASPHGGTFNNGELWRSDGTPQGTVLVRDISATDPLDVVSSRSGLINVGGTLYFSANDGDHGYELWRSNGTKSTTLMVRDLAPRGDNPTVDGSYPQNLSDVNGTLFFSAGGFLWKTDGTASGTIKLKTVTAARGFVNANGLLFFVSDDNLWLSDGTREGTLKVGDQQIAEQFGATGTAALNGRLYFGADGGSGYELYESDGTATHTALAHEAEIGTASSHAQVLGRAGHKIVFIARDATTALWQVYSLDIPAPHAPVALRLATQSDSGISNSDRVTHVNRPIISGTAPAGSRVRLFINGGEVGTGLATAGTFNIIVNRALPDRTHTITASAIDDLGRTSTRSSALNVKIDTSAPRARFTAVSAKQLELKFTESVGATLRPEDIAIRNTATGDSVSTEDIHIQYVDRTNTAIITFTSLPDGLLIAPHELTISAGGVTDIAGNALAAPTAFKFTPPAPAVGLASSLLHIDGGEGDDVIIVRVKPAEPELLQVLLNGETSEYLIGRVTGIRIDALGGDDLIQFDHNGGAIKIASTIYAGAGNDTVYGSATRDRISGGEGNDLLHGSGGHDIIYGEAGNDLLQGERGDDYLVGGEGINTIQGNAGTDRLFGTADKDDIHLDVGDVFTSV